MKIDWKAMLGEERLAIVDCIDYSFRPNAADGGYSITFLLKDGWIVDGKPRLFKLNDEGVISLKDIGELRKFLDEAQNFGGYDG